MNDIWRSPHTSTSHSSGFIKCTVICCIIIRPIHYLVLDHECVDKGTKVSMSSNFYLGRQFLFVTKLSETTELVNDHSKSPYVHGGHRTFGDLQL